MNGRENVRTNVTVFVAVLFCAAAPAADGDGSINLRKYKLKGAAKPMAQIHDASGLAFSPVTKTIFSVNNANCDIVEFGLDGSTQRLIKTTGFSDVEGIVHVGGNTFFVAEEGRGNICKIEITPETKTLDYASATVFKVDDGKLGNQGLEGVAYDPATKHFFCVKEKSPRKIYEIELPADGKAGPAKVTQPFDIEQNSLGLLDLSDIHFDPKSGHFLILSHESHCVVEVTREGKEVSRLIVGAVQEEGVTMDAERNVYVCSEPDQLYVFSATK